MSLASCICAFADRLLSSLSDLPAASAYIEEDHDVMTDGSSSSAFHELFDPANADVTRIFRNSLEGLLFTKEEPRTEEPISAFVLLLVCQA